MSSLPPPRVPGRLVSYKDGKEKFVTAGGAQLQWKDGAPNAILDSRGNFLRNAIWSGKLVSFKNGLEKYAVASECCEYPIARDNGSLLSDMAWVEQAKWPPYGISKHIRVFALADSACPDRDYANGLLVYNGSGHWLGSVFGITVDMYLSTFVDGSDPTGTERVAPAFDLNLAACGGGASTANATGTTIRKWNAAFGNGFIAMLGGGSVFPLRAASTGTFAVTPCCSCAVSLSTIKFLFHGFCKRARLGRLVGFKDGIPRYVVGSDCPPRQSTNCCDLNANCNLAADIAVNWSGTSPSGTGCGSFSTACSATGVASILLNPAYPTSSIWRWKVGSITWNGSSPNQQCAAWTLFARCEVLNKVCLNGLPATRWYFRLEYGGGLGCEPGFNCQCASETYVDVCDCNPLQIPFRLTCNGIKVRYTAGPVYCQFETYTFTISGTLRWRS